MGKTPYVHTFGHRMTRLSAISAMAGSSDTTCFGSLEFPTLPPVRMWGPPIFEPSQPCLFGSLDFIADQLGVLDLREEALVPAAVGGPSSIGSRTPNDFNDEALALHSKQTLCSNLTVSNVRFVIYLLFTIFHRFSGGTPLSLPRPPCDWIPYGLASPTDAYAQGLRRMLAPPPLTSEFVGMASHAPTCFHDLMDDDVESDGSSISDIEAPSHPLSQEYAMTDALG